MEVAAQVAFNTFKATVSVMHLQPRLPRTFDDGCNAFFLCVRSSSRRSPAHCIEYAHLIQWGQERSGEEFDTDNEEHMTWVFNQASKRAAQYGIQVREVGFFLCTP